MTADIPAHECGVDGCHEQAVARLFRRADHNGDGGYRCRDCLDADLD